MGDRSGRGRRSRARRRKSGTLESRAAHRLARGAARDSRSAVDRPPRPSSTRYLIGVVPAASLCGAYLLTRIPRWWGAAAVVAACVWAVGPVADWYRSPFSEDWRAAGAYVDTNRAKGDHLTVTD